MKINKSHLSRESFCLSESTLEKLNRDKNNQTYICDILFDQKDKDTRSFYLINIQGINYWANAMTGSLYKEDGTCVTSKRLSLSGVPVANILLLAA